VPDYGVAGPTRRYALIVGMLVALATVPTLIVLAVGAAWVGDRHSGGTPPRGASTGDPVIVLSPPSGPARTGSTVAVPPAGPSEQPLPPPARPVPVPVTAQPAPRGARPEAVPAATDPVPTPEPSPSVTPEPTDAASPSPDEPDEPDQTDEPVGSAPEPVPSCHHRWRKTVGRGD
jgi:hypothetical protein